MEKTNQLMRLEDVRLFADTDMESHGKVTISLTLDTFMECKTSAVTERSAAVFFKEGWNEILVKAAVQCEKPYSGREYGFNLRVVDEEDLLIKDLIYLP